MQKLSIFVVLATLACAGLCSMPVFRKTIPETHTLRIGFPIMDIKRTLAAYFHRPTFKITWPEELGNKPPFGWVTIDSKGWIVAAHTFDYEALPQNDKTIQFTVTAKNGRPSRYDRRRRHHGRTNERHAKIIIDVIDENDELPLLESPIGGVVYVERSAFPGTTVYTLVAHDADERARLRFGLRGDTDCSGNFTVDEITGEISVTTTAGGITGHRECILQATVTDEDSCSRTEGCQTDTVELKMLLQQREELQLRGRGTSLIRPEDRPNLIDVDSGCPPFTQPDPLNPDSCIELPEECIPNPCLHNGVCTAGNPSASGKPYFCKCIPGWGGERCEIHPSREQVYQIPEEQNNTYVEVRKRPEEIAYPPVSSPECIALEHQCRATADAELCSGKGECRCGECWCPTTPQGWSHWYGNFCECNDWECPKVEGRMCNGRGTCECGKCVCHKGWGGDSCDCRTNDALCFPPNGGEKCSGRGVCHCGACHCEDGYAGSACHCEKIIQVPAP